MASIVVRMAGELGVEPWRVEAAVGLLDAGATVPFVARYRKEATGALDDVQLRALAERLDYLRELEARRTQVLESATAQGRTDPATLAAIAGAETKARLEDVYAPFKPRRRTKAQVAREAGLGPLRDALVARPDLPPEEQALAFVDEGKSVATTEAALEGARAILAETLTEDADLVGRLRERFWKEGRMTVRVRPGREGDGAKYSDYFDRVEPLSGMPSHRVLAILRGEREGFLDLDMRPDETEDHAGFPAAMAARAGFSNKGRAGDGWLLKATGWAWRARMRPALSVDLRGRLFESAEGEAIGVFAGNLRDLLLAAPAGPRPTMGLDPGLRTGVKVAVVDSTGKVVATDTIHPHEPRNERDAAMSRLARLARTHAVELVAVGNGTASRETERLVADLARAMPELGLTKAVVSEAGASVYSASEAASMEMPDLDVTLRGAVSIARRLQDPLSELVKVEPKAVGVGQYQHDVSQHRLARSLDAVVEDCVNAVGVDLNTASVPLLARVSGLGEHLARAIVAHRDAMGPFRTRADLLGVPRLGPKAYEQAAGFLRVRGSEPLDRSAVHPESYPLARRILASVDPDPAVAMGKFARIGRPRPEAYATDGIGLPTVNDVIDELRRPGRDPRPSFVTASFKDGVETVADLVPGMVLEGTVTNVAAFGAFVDVGVHRDGLVHVSAMSKRRLSDPRSAAKVGDVVRVKVLSVDARRNAVSLTMRLDDPLPAASDAVPASVGRPAPAAPPTARTEGALADAFRRASATDPRTSRRRNEP